MPRSSLTFFCLNHHKKAPFASKKEDMLRWSSCKLRNGFRVTFKNKDHSLSHTIRAHCVDCGLTNASLLLCSCRLVSSSLKEAACCSATICAWALDAAAAAVFNASWLKARSPSSRRHSAWLCRRCSPVCRKQGSQVFFFCISYFVVLEIRSMSASWHFSQLGWNPCRMSNYLSQGRVSLHAKLLFVDIFFSANGKSLLEIIRSHWRTCCRSFRQTSKNFFCLIGAGRCWESKHQFGWFLCWPHRRRRGSASMGGNDIPD